jgi:predicted component of type VI protein secretion system
MATLTIPFPEGTRTVSLRGNRITIGRLADNTIQIRDRTVSAYHAELIIEGDHYRVHDTASTNGVLINGQRAADYHLHEACKVQLGSLVCEFGVGEAPAEDDGNALATRSEMLAVQQSNTELKQRMEALRAQVDGMLKAREGGNGSEASVALDKYDQLAADAVALRNTLQERQTQIDRLTTLLAVVTRERDNLQRGYDDARGALEKAKAPNAPATPAAPPVPRATTPSAPAVPRSPAGTNGSGTSTSPLPKPPMSLPGSTPSRRPPSAVTAPVGKAPAFAATPGGPVGPKGTQKLVE